jgi:hypothetical protein
MINNNECSKIRIESYKEGLLYRLNYLINKNNILFEEEINILKNEIGRLTEW